MINAAGPQARLLGKMVGLELPVDPRRRHIFVPSPLIGSGVFVPGKDQNGARSPSGSGVSNAKSTPAISR